MSIAFPMLVREQLKNTHTRILTTGFCVALLKALLANVDFLSIFRQCQASDMKSKRHLKNVKTCLQIAGLFWGCQNFKVRCCKGSFPAKRDCFWYVQIFGTCDGDMFQIQKMPQTMNHILQFSCGICWIGQCWCWHVGNANDFGWQRLSSIVTSNETLGPWDSLDSVSCATCTLMRCFFLFNYN